MNDIQTQGLTADHAVGELAKREHINLLYASMVQCNASLALDTMSNM